MVGAHDRRLFDEDMAVSVRIKQTALDPAGKIVIDKAVDLYKKINVHAVIQDKPAAGKGTSIFVGMIILFPLTLHEIARMQGRQLLRLGF